MEIDFGTELIGFDGVPVMKEALQATNDEGELIFQPDGITPVMIPSQEIAILGNIAKLVLTRMTKEDQNLSGDKKWDYEKLAARVYKGGKHEVTAEEISLLKKRIGRMYGPITLGSCYRILESPVGETSCTTNSKKTSQK